MRQEVTPSEAELKYAKPNFRKRHRDKQTDNLYSNEFLQKQANVAPLLEQYF